MPRPVREKARKPRRLSVAAWIVIAGSTLLAGGLAYIKIERWLREPSASAPRAEFRVEGLDCPFWCAVRLTESIDALDGAIVESIDQSVGTIVVRHDPDRQGEAELRSLLEASGFAVKGVQDLAR